MWAYLQKRFLRNNLRVAVILRSVNQVHTMFALTPCISKLFLYKLLCYSELILPPQQHPHVFLSLPFPPQLCQQLTTCWLIWFCFLIAEPIGLRSRTDGEKQEKCAARTEARLLTNSSSAGVPELSLKARPKGAVSEYLKLSLCCCQGRWLPPSAGTRCSLRSTLALVWHGRTGDHLFREKKEVLGTCGYPGEGQGPSPGPSTATEHRASCYLARYF